ncbi:hypothetical protein [Nocardia sp. XZ_19_369]|uniref:hypothetical protein n=1 Tax=Nocardia sp. XZ_19_369 TaxID=2769487 RepID=UPI00188ED5C5|nr:hypothetical protein [Nocardia sp. XZ_19_369]
MRWEYFANKYSAELSLLSRFCTKPAEVGSTGGGCYGLCGQLRNGLNVLASNGELEGNDDSGWTLGLYHVDEQLAYIPTGTLHDQLTMAAGLTPAQLQALISHSPGQVPLPAEMELL